MTNTGLEQMLEQAGRSALEDFVDPDTFEAMLTHAAASYRSTYERVDPRLRDAGARQREARTLANLYNGWADWFESVVEAYTKDSIVQKLGFPPDRQQGPCEQNSSNAIIHFRERADHFNRSTVGIEEDQLRANIRDSPLFRKIDDSISLRYITTDYNKLNSLVQKYQELCHETFGDEAPMLQVALTPGIHYSKARQCYLRGGPFLGVTNGGTYACGFQINDRGESHFRGGPIITVLMD